MSLHALTKKEKARAYGRAHYEANKEAYKTRARERRLKVGPKIVTPEKRQETHLRTKYGLTVAAYNDMLEAQGGVCAICRGPNQDWRRLHVDHDHKTGKIRALLCRDCNHTLGKFKDSPELFRAAAEYLERHSGV